MSTQPTPSMRGLISLDGNTNIISIQLRLLPPSPKVLVLPPLSTLVQQPQSNVPFDARAFIRHVHEALSARIELARSFLHSSSSTQPRLVFMNGGSASALTICIAKIREKVTNGNTEEADQLFTAIAKGGVAGLLHEGEAEVKRKGKAIPIPRAVNSMLVTSNKETRSPSSASHIEPSVTDAADFIDRLIDSLQKPLPNLPVDGRTVSMEDAAPDTRTTTTPVPPDVPRLKSRFWTDQQVIPRSERVAKEANRGRKVNGEGKRFDPVDVPYIQYTSRDSSAYTDAVMFQERATSNGDNLDSQPERPASAPSSQNLTKQQPEYSYSYVDGKLSRHVVEKSKSVDYLHRADISAPLLDMGPHKLKLGTFSPFTFSPLLRSETSSVSDSETSDLSESSNSLDSTPGVADTIPPEIDQEHCSPPKTLFNDLPDTYRQDDPYSGDMANAKRVSTAISDVTSVKEPTPFEPIFAMVEDLIIHFKNTSGNEVLESVLRSYKNGTYPPIARNVPQVPTTPTSPASLFSSSDNSLSGASHTSADTEQDWHHGIPKLHIEKENCRPSDEDETNVPKASSDISPYCPPDSPSDIPSDSPSIYPSDDGSIDPSNGPSDSEPFWPKNEHSRNTVHGILKPRLQIPVTNPTAPPPELILDAGQKIHELSDTCTTNTIVLQNSFRDVLKIHYPPESTHYKQHIFALENDRFWKPVFRAEAKPGCENRTVDQIIALGYEDGVEKALYKELVEQFDKLGTTATGTRASKLDIRFLVIYAMQTFTSQPLSLQAGENPFSQPSLLATLLIPHLETFLSSSCPTRLLILHYPVSHLSTVLALRDLLGSKLLKVAGIIDSTAISPPKPSKERPNSIASVDEWVSTTTSQSPSPTQEGRATRAHQVTRNTMVPQPSFSKADFLLLSPATEDEISTFLTSVWESLNFPSSSFYMPDEVLSPSNTAQPISSSSTVSTHNAPPTPPPDRQSAAPVARPQKRISPTRAPKRVSFAESTTSTEISTENARRRERQSEKDWEKSESERRERLSEKAWESFIMGNDSDESLLELERIFLPHLHFMPRTARRLGDPRKAMKWLGLD